MQPRREPPTIESRLRVIRKRKAVSLKYKLSEYAELFNLKVIRIAQDKVNGEYEVFESDANGD
jgi:hypothetical protein